jgi:1-acyl-sn-glycerol-3-phosphate acyltransferase
MGHKGNTLVRVIDFLLNLSVIAWFLAHLIDYPQRDVPLGIVLAYWAYRSLLNIGPLLRIAYYTLSLDKSEETVVRAVEAVRPHYFIDRVSPYYRETPVIYVANHALWSLDDVVALASLSAPDLLVVINQAPSGIATIPENCRERLCAIDRRGKTGYEALRNIVKEEVVEKRRSLVIFAEDMSKKKRVEEPAPLRTGTFKIASEFGLPIVPMWIDWPCQFPSILRSTEKILKITEGRAIPTAGINYEETRQTALRQLAALSQRT